MVQFIILIFLIFQVIYLYINIFFDPQAKKFTRYERWHSAVIRVPYDLSKKHYVVSPPGWAHRPSWLLDQQGIIPTSNNIVLNINGAFKLVPYCLTLNVYAYTNIQSWFCLGPVLLLGWLGQMVTGQMSRCKFLWVNQHTVIARGTLKNLWLSPGSMLLCIFPSPPHEETTKCFNGHRMP